MPPDAGSEVGRPPRARVHLEDLEIGRVVALGSTSVTREEIIAYAQAFDPQTFHLDEEAAKASMIGRLCASGWHSCCILMRLVADGFLLDAASLGSPGMDEVRWLKPVFPDDRLSGRFTCLAKRELRSRPGIGLATMLFELTNGDGEVVMTWNTSQLLALRNRGNGGAAA